MMRVFLGSWTTPGGNNVEAYIQADASAYRAALYWDDPPPFRNPADLDYYLSVILPAIVRLAQEYTETTGRAVVVLGT